MISSQHHLGVVDQVEGEDESPGPPVDHLEIFVVGNKYHHEPEDDEAEEDADKNSSHRGEVPLGLKTNVEIFFSNIRQIFDELDLESKDCESQNNPSGDSSSNNDSIHIIEHTDLRSEVSVSYIFTNLSFLTIPRDTPSNRVNNPNRIKFIGTCLELIKYLVKG